MEIPRQKGFVHIYMLHPDDDDVPSSAATLSDDEQTSAAAFSNADDRAQYIALHAFVRTTLSNYIHTPPAYIDIRSTPQYHKPYIHTSSGPPPVYFNTSHRPGLALLAISDRPVGIDVEHYHPIDNIADVATDYFSPKEQQWLFGTALSTQRLYRFFRLWTLKEAYIKAIGLGISYPLNSFSVINNADGRLGLDIPDANNVRWCLKELSVPDDYIAAIAFQEG